MTDTNPTSIELLDQLIAFDTTSRNSNLDLIAFVQSYLDDLQVESHLVYDESGSKANLYCTLGPQDIGGVALSGHTDVVPVDGQNWDTDPFKLSAKGTRLYARGTSDMKSFIAVCLSLLPQILRRRLKTPLHLLLSYDEEVGCIGARRLIDDLAKLPVRPTGCIVGEPTSMQIVRAHKGKLSVRCHVRGLAGHSGLTHLGVNAVEAAAEIVAHLKRLARNLRDNGPYDHALEPAFTTAHTGLIQGGTQLNIIPDYCFFDFEFRNLPAQNTESLYDDVLRFAETLLPEMQAVHSQAGFEWELLSGVAALNTPEDADIVKLAQHLTGANTTGKVSYCTEAGLFSEAGIPSIICGPGSIEQAHKPNEWIECEQIQACERFILKLADHLAN